VKKSNKALELAERIAGGNRSLFPDPIFDDIGQYLCGNYYEWFTGNYNAEHRILCLCLYAAILKDEGK
jgi:hypothetical protein